MRYILNIKDSVLTKVESQIINRKIQRFSNIHRMIFTPQVKVEVENEIQNLHNYI